MYGQVAFGADQTIFPLSTSASSAICFQLKPGRLRVTLFRSDPALLKRYATTEVGAALRLTQPTFIRWLELIVTPTLDQDRLGESDGLAAVNSIVGTLVVCLPAAESA